MGSFTRGAFHYYLGKHFAHHSVAITFDPATMALICQPEGSEDTMQLPIQGITKAELMGDCDPTSLADVSIRPSLLVASLATA